MDGNGKPYGYVQSGVHQGLTTSSGMCYKLVKGENVVYTAVTDRCGGYCRAQETYDDKFGTAQTTEMHLRNVQECSQVNRFNTKEIKTHTTCTCDKDKIPFDTNYSYSAPSFLNVSYGNTDTCIDDPTLCCGRDAEPAMCDNDVCNADDIGQVRCDHCASQLALEFDLDVTAFKYLCSDTTATVTVQVDPATGQNITILGTGTGSAGSCEVDSVTPFECSGLLTVPSGLDGRNAQRGVNCPTLVVRGSESEVFPTHNLEKLCALIPHAEKQQIDADHRVSQDNPKALAAVIDAFILRQL